MDYFTLLNLTREPFANSPDPDMFYGSGLHRRCLQDLEIAVRLRRGLAVVIGEIGTGKSTLCRQLIRKLDSGDPRPAVKLLLEPEFSSPRELLDWIIESFGLGGGREDLTDRQLKERFKDYLLEEGEARNRLVILIIDEGQKLPGFALEILRELLNYETNQHKLLQIVIFAQEEFSAALREKPNFADRIACFTHLPPLSLEETTELIRHRLRHAHRSPESAPELFSRSAYRLIHRITGGYPRKVIMLCSQIMMAMIIQNRTRVDAALVRACAGRMFGSVPRNNRRLPWAGYTAAGLAAAGLLVWQLGGSPDSVLPSSSLKPFADLAGGPPITGQAPPVNYRPFSAPSEGLPLTPSGSPPAEPPEIPQDSPGGYSAQFLPAGHEQPDPEPNPAADSVAPPTGEKLLAERIAATGSWLQSVDRKRFTIQLAQVESHPDTLEQMLRVALRSDIAGRIYIYQELGSSPARWKLLYGDYAAVGEARQDVVGLPAPLRAYRPFVRNISAIIEEAEEPTRKNLETGDR